MDEEFSPLQRHAIARTLDDLEGWGTLYGTLICFDPLSGRRLDPPAKHVGVYDRTPRGGLPSGWEDLFIARGWIDIVQLGNGTTAWKPTTLGREISRRWLSEHHQGAAFE